VDIRTSTGRHQLPEKELAPFVPDRHALRFVNAVDDAFGKARMKTGTLIQTDVAVKA
jgi:hypothetical protein